MPTWMFVLTLLVIGAAVIASEVLADIKLVCDR